MPVDVQARSAYQEHTSTQTVSQEYTDEKENNEEGISASTEDGSLDGSSDGSSDETSDNSENTEENTTEETSDEEGVAIQNEFAYIIGVVVSNKQDAVQPDLELLDVFADQLNYRNVISANLQNVTPTFVNRLEVEATVQKVGEEEILYKESQEQMQMAPNSNFNFPIFLDGDRFRSGDYVLKMTARSGEDEWQWERNFTIEADEARALNQQDVTIDTNINWWMIGSIILLVLLLGIVLYLFLHKRKKEQHNKITEKE